MSLWAVLLTGLFAGGASCAVVQGGLLAGAVARRRPAASGVGPRAAKPPAAPASAQSDGAVSVSSFLAGKLVSHVALGAALGLLGDAVQMGRGVRAVMQFAAGAVMILLALDLLGVRAVRAIVPSAPRGWVRLVRRSGRIGGSLGPAVLGASTVLIPCGVTLSMMFLAIAAGSPLSGAAIMGTFVVGTAPLFAVIGYAARRATAHLRGRLTMLAGLAVLAAALIAINSGLALGGSSVTLASAWRSALETGEAPAVEVPAAAADGVQRIIINVEDTRYSPASTIARAGVPTEVTFRTNNTQGCTRAIIITSLNVEKVLPATGDTRIDLGELEPGMYRYTCGMGMYSGSIKVVDS